MVVGRLNSDIQNEVLAEDSTHATFRVRYDLMKAMEHGKSTKADLTDSEHRIPATVSMSRFAYQRNNMVP